MVSLGTLIRGILGATLVVLLGASTESASSLAGPRVVLVYGADLPAPIALTNWEKNVHLMLALSEPLDPDPDYDTRPFLELALFWGWRWDKHISDGGRPEDLSPAAAEQHGRLYLGAGGQQPVIEWRAEALRGSEASAPRSISGEARQILSAFGVPLYLSTIGPPGTGDAGMR
jgi:hypothetical protein